MSRDTQLRIKVEEKVKYQLDLYADQLGLTTSALCAFVLGQFVHQQTRVIAPLVEQLQGELREGVREELRRLLAASPTA